MASEVQAGLYLIATPIGNLGDVTYRAVETLQSVDVIFCEDTRISRRLLDRYGIKADLKVYNDFSDEQDRQRIVDRLLKGEAIALISDAGMPLISDPGFKLLAAVRDAGLPVTALPGPSAMPTALALSGLPPHPAFFAGFLPPRSGARVKALEALADIDGTLVFYESPRRIKAALSDMLAALGDRNAALLRELTKRHEQVATGPISILLGAVGTDVPLRGEFVIVLGPPTDHIAELDSEAADKALKALVTEHGVKEAVKQFVAKTGQPRNTVYQRALELKPGADRDD